MNMRRESIVEMIIDRIQVLNIAPNDLVIITLPKKLTSKISNAIGSSIVDALRSLNKPNHVVALPEDIKIQTLNDTDMRELGWERINKE
jgi:hypothetical protein